MTRFLRIRQVCDRTGLSRSVIYQRMREGQFPRSIPIGSSSTIGWIEADIDEYVAQQVRTAREPAQAR